MPQPQAPSPSQQSWYEALGESTGDSHELGKCFGFSCGGFTRDVVEEFEWVKSSQETDVGLVYDVSSPIGLLSSVSKPPDILSQGAVFFVGLTTNPTCAVVDTAAQDGLIGQQALERLKEEWQSRVCRLHGPVGKLVLMELVEQQK